MLTANQLIFVIRSMFPSIEDSDHGRTYWVGMPVNGDDQIADAFIMEDRDAIREPFYEPIYDPIYEEILDENGDVIGHSDTIIGYGEIVGYSQNVLAYGEVIGYGPNKLWNVPGVPQPSQEQLLTKWADPQVQADYAQFLAASAAPIIITNRQGQLALLEVGMLDEVEAMIAGIVDPLERRTAQIEFGSPTWSSDSEFVKTMWEKLGGTDVELKALFELALTK